MLLINISFIESYSLSHIMGIFTYLLLRSMLGCYIIYSWNMNLKSKQEWGLHSWASTLFIFTHSVCLTLKRLLCTWNRKVWNFSKTDFYNSYSNYMNKRIPHILFSKRFISLWVSYFNYKMNLWQIFIWNKHAVRKIEESFTLWYQKPQHRKRTEFNADFTKNFEYNG